MPVTSVVPFASLFDSFSKNPKHIIYSARLSRKPALVFWRKHRAIFWLIGFHTFVIKNFNIFVSLHGHQSGQTKITNSWKSRILALFRDFWHALHVRVEIHKFRSLKHLNILHFGPKTAAMIIIRSCDSVHFYPNVTTLRSGLCFRNSVCRLSVCLSSVCNVGAPYSGGWTFRQYFFIAVYAGHPLTSVQNFT